LKGQNALLDTVRSLQGNIQLTQMNPEVEALVQQVCGLIIPKAGSTEIREGTTQEYESPRLSHSGGPISSDPAIPGYEILGRLGRGGMGVVFKVRHTHLGKLMALKLLPPRGQVSALSLARFRAEMQAIGRLNHLHIVQAHDAGETKDGVPYLAMEYLEGSDLAKLVDENGPLAVADACEIIHQAALGLEHVQEHGLVHRDLKPSNLFLTTSGVVKILDLGLALFRDEPANLETTTLAGDPMGTPACLAPEQWLDAHAVSIQADLYSLGCTLYHLLAGKPPFEGSDVRDLKQNHLKETPTPIRQRRADVPGAVADLLDRLLAKDPACRPATPTEAAQVLQPYAAGSCLTAMMKPGASLPRAKEEKRRRFFRPRIVIAVGFVLAGLCLLAGITYIATDRGTLVIKTEEPDVEVMVKQAGKVVVILDKKTGKEVTLRSGTYELELQGGQPGLKLKTDRLILSRGDREIVEIYLEKKPIAASGWIAKRPIPIGAPSGGYMAAEVNGLIYVFGGLLHSDHPARVLDILWQYNPGTDTWKQLEKPKKTDEGDAGRNNGALGVIDGKLYLAGGWRMKPPLPTDTLLIYDPAKNFWSTGAKMPILSGTSVGGAIGKKLYVMTACDGKGGYKKYLHVYDPETDKWGELPSPPHFHTGAGGGVIDGKFYVVGGQPGTGFEDGGLAPLAGADLDVYDPRTNTWQTKRALPEPRRALACAVSNGKIYALGGADQLDEAANTVYVYDPATDKWDVLPPLPKAVGQLAAAAIGRTLYALGGSDGKASPTRVYALQLGEPLAPR
jgi:N-acetylneuraminic acid mutarotase